MTFSPFTKIIKQKLSFKRRVFKNSKVFKLRFGTCSLVTKKEIKLEVNSFKFLKKIIKQRFKSRKVRRSFYKRKM